MSQKEEIKAMYGELDWKMQKMKQQLTEIESKFEHWKEAYIIIENDLRIFKKLLKEF